MLSAEPQVDSRGATSTPPRPAVLAAIACAACATTAASIALAVSHDVSDVQIALLQWISVPYIVAGLIAWRRRPDSRLGLLMIAGGFATALSALQLATAPALQTIGSLVDVLPAALFLHVFLSFPSGRLRTRFERVLVAIAYAAALGLQLVKISLGAYGPEHLLAVWAQAAAAQAVERVQLLSLAAICIAGVGVLVMRRRAGPPRRRSLALLVDSFAIVLVLIAALYVLGAFDGPAFVTMQRITLLAIGLSPIAFLAGLLDARLARSNVGDLVVALRSDPDPRGLRDALARALRDESLTLAFWLPEFGSYADADGGAVQVPDPDGRRVATLIERDGTVIAALLHDPSLTDEPQLLQSVTAAAAIALENARLQVELRARLEELRASRARILEAGQAERQRLERNLHDGAQQRLVALSLELSLLEGHLGDSGGAEAKARLGHARSEIATSLAELREIARGLHPAVVSGHGLPVALEQLAALAPVPVVLTVDVDGRLPEALEVAAYYLVCESLANIGKYAQASSATVAVRRTGEHVVVEVIDDGVGGADPERGSGLRGLADRVEALDGKLKIWSAAGSGTRVLAELPCAP